MKLLQAVDIPTPDEAIDAVGPRSVRRRARSTARRSSAYRDEEDVDPDSVTETYRGHAASGGQLALGRGARSTSGRASGCPARVTEVALQFQQVPHLPFDRAASRDLRPDALILRIQPDEGITLEFGAKVPGEAFRIRSVAMDFSYAETFAGDRRPTATSGCSTTP